MQEGEALKRFLDRFTKMNAARKNFEPEWLLDDAQTRAVSYYDTTGKLIVNVPMEQNLIEVSAGRQAGKLVYDMEPMGKVDMQELEPAKYTLDYFLETGDFFREKKQFVLDKIKYGTAAFYCGLTYDSYVEYEMKDGTKVYSDPFYYVNNYNKYTKDKWDFAPKNVPLRNIWFDEAQIFQPNYKKCIDCIIQEVSSPDTIKQRRGKTKWFYTDNVNDISILTPSDYPYGITPLSVDQCVIHYYYDNFTKDYLIVANYKLVLFVGKMIYNFPRNQLPISVAQHFPLNNSIYGLWLPRKLRYLKAYKSGMMQGALDKTFMSSGINLGMGNEVGVDGQLYTSSGEINVWKFTGGIDQVKQFQLDSNITSMVNMLNVIDDFVIQDTGENLKAPYTSPAGTLGEVEIMEENKQIRMKAIDESYEMALDDALTMTYSNIRRFAPKLLKKTTKVKTQKGKDIEKTEFPMIRVPNVTVKKEKGKIVFEEDFGNYGFFELKEDVLPSELIVKIVTPSTKSSLKTLEKNSYTQYINNIATILKIDPQLISQIDFSDILEYMNTVYGYEKTMNVDTKKDQREKANLALQDAIKQMVGLQNLDANQLWNAGGTDIWQSSTTNGEPTAQGEAQSLWGDLQQVWVWWSNPGSAQTAP